MEGENLNNVLIFGTGSTCKFVLTTLKLKNVNIIAYVDNDQKKWNSSLNGIKILSPEKIKDLKYDFIIIASEFYNEIYLQLLSMNVDKNKIVLFYKYYDSYLNPVNNMLESYKKNIKDIECIITGICYAVCGINESTLYKKSYKFALASQDLYYDYNIVKYILNNNNNIKYALIGLCYYNFQYDLSMSKNKNRVIIYNDILKCKHNLSVDDLTVLEEEFTINKRILSTICDKNNDIVRFKSKNFDFKKYSYIEKYNMGSSSANEDGNKNYPKTVIENKNILMDYLDLLKKHNIKPIIVVFPVTTYYANKFPLKLEEEFKDIINDLKESYDFQYIDYFRSSLFSDDDFYDVSHLNEKGAYKFTNILNDTIEW